MSYFSTAWVLFLHPGGDHRHVLSFSSPKIILIRSQLER
jgi:hypothetical protein